MAEGTTLRLLPKRRTWQPHRAPDLGSAMTGIAVVLSCRVQRLRNWFAAIELAFISIEKPGSFGGM